MTKPNLYSIDHARNLAKSYLPKVVFDYIDGAADDEITMRLNRSAFDEVYFNPKMAQGKFIPNLKVKILGYELDLPVLLAPCGLVRVMHPDGALGVAKAAVNKNTVSVLSTVAGSSIAEVATVDSNLLWYQLYSSNGRAEIESVIDELNSHKIEVLVVTVDTPALGNRLRDIENGVSTPLRINSSNAIQLGYQVLSKPRWTYNMLKDGIKLFEKSKDLREDNRGNSGKDMLQMAASPFSWDDIKWIKQIWNKKLVVKGILSGSDAKKAVDSGADAVVISNHGGRQLEGVSPTFMMLPEIVSSVNKNAEVILDSGIRRGSHVLKALALGANAVMIGRPYLYGLAVNGQKGVENILEIFKTELIRDMNLLGCKNLEALDETFLIKKSQFQF